MPASESLTTAPAQMSESPQDQNSGDVDHERRIDQDCGAGRSARRVAADPLISAVLAVERIPASDSFCPPVGPSGVRRPLGPEPCLERKRGKSGRTLLSGSKRGSPGSRAKMLETSAEEGAAMSSEPHAR